MAMVDKILMAETLGAVKREREREREYLFSRHKTLLFYCFKFEKRISQNRVGRFSKNSKKAKSVCSIFAVI